MQQLRSKITRLKSKMEEKLPEGDDLFGYPGVSKTGLAEYVDEIYGLTYTIEKLRGGFSLVVLHRKIDPRIDRCKEFINEQIGSKHAAEAFDGFLTALTAIHDEVFLTHVIYCSEGVRTEAEVGAAVEALNQARTEFHKISPEATAAVAELTSLKEMSTQADEWYSNIESAHADTESFKEAAKKAADDASASFAITSKFEAEIKTQSQSLSNISVSAHEAEKKLAKVVAKAGQDSKTVDKALADVEELRKKTVAQSESIETTLRLASKHGMASSFQQRKQELKAPLIFWASLFSLSMASLVVLGIYFIVPELKTAGAGDIAQLLVRVTLLAPLIWLGWMSAKQYGYVSRIREDYSFKYASALAFEGYKKEATEGHPEVLEDLLKVATENMALNPLRIYGPDSNHASPLQELVASALKNVDSKSLGIEIKDAVTGVLRKKINPSGD